MSQAILVVILICLILVLIMLLGSVGASVVVQSPEENLEVPTGSMASLETNEVPTGSMASLETNEVPTGSMASLETIEVPRGPMASSDHYPEPSGTIDDGADVVAIEDLPEIAQQAEQLDWVEDAGKTIVDLGATCGEVKVFDPTKLYPGKSRDQYANYCNSMHSNRECQDRTCSVPLIMYACRDGCTDGLQSSHRKAKIGKGAERITYAEYRAWKDGKSYPGSGASTWKEHCVWKDALGFKGLDGGAEPCSQHYNRYD